MKKSTKIAIGVGAALALAGGIALAANSSSSAPKQPTTPTPVSWSFVQGHSYSISITVDPAWAQTNPMPALNVPLVQAALNKVFGAVFTVTGVTQPAPNQVVIALDFVGPSATVSLPPGTSLPPGARIQVNDLGPTGGVQPGHYVGPASVQAPGPYTIATSITPGNTYLIAAIVPPGVSIASMLQALPAAVQVVQQWNLGELPPNWPSNDPNAGNPQAVRLVAAYNGKVSLPVLPNFTAWKAG